MNDHMELCTVGLKTSDKCHLTTYTKRLSCKQGVKSADNLSQEERELILLRSGIDSFSELDTVCLHHEAYFLKEFRKKFKKCLDLFNIHGERKVNASREINLSLAKTLMRKGFTAKPGQKLCKRCHMSAKKYECEDVEECCENDLDDDDAEMVNLDVSLHHEEVKSKVAEKLETLEQSPLVLHSKKRAQKVKTVKAKLMKVTRSLASDMAAISGLDVAEVDPIQNENQLQEEGNLKKDGAALGQLMDNLKSKFSASDMSHGDKVQVLTLVPSFWTVERTVKFFGASRYSVLQARQLVQKHGILSRPGPRKPRSGIPEEVKNNVKLYYENNEFTRIMPGRKDKVSTVWGKESQQKRLILCTVKDLLANYRKDFPDHKIEWATFAALRPKWCVLPGSSGTHNVCVCQHHQNVVLLANACGIEYPELVKMVVCDVGSKRCMVHRCDKCPGIDALVEKLRDHFDDRCPDDVINYQQWTSTDSTRIDHCTLSVEDFIDFVAAKIDAFTAHSFIAKCQAKYLKERKEALQEDECLLLLDFAENFQFVIQDEVQGYHWCKLYCTVHPAVIYVMQDGNLVHYSFCVISDDITHDTSFVYALQKLMCEHIRNKFPNIKKVEYFSDGCAGQYKNYKNFLNLTYHTEDFSLTAVWTFFATSHGKSPCDGIGGTVKRKLYRESLTRVVGQHILTSKTAFEFCKDAIASISFFHLSADDLSITRRELEKRYEQGMTVPGTQSYHMFIPNGIGQISYKRTSEDCNLAGTWSFFDAPQSYDIKDILIGDYVACFFDELLWIGCVINIDADNNELFINFLHNNVGTLNHFYYPQREDKCVVPIASIVLKVGIPNVTLNGRKYYLCASDFKHLQNIC